MKQEAYLATGREMRLLDRTAIEDFGLPGVVLMENAAQSIFRAVMAQWMEWPADPRVAILIGPGQNGGDGWALARIFSAHGFQVLCYLAKLDGTEISGDAAVNYKVARRLGLPVTELKSDGPWPEWEKIDLLIDALFGTGLDRPLTGPAAAVLASAAKAKTERGPRLRVAAVDIPSGLSGDDGRLWGPPLAADLTVTLGAPKIGLYLGDGPELSGRIVVGDIGLTPEMFARSEPHGLLAGPDTLAQYLPPRAPDGHKGVFGHVLLAGGAKGKTGALVLAALGAARSGAALVTALHPASLAPIYESKLTEVMTLELPEDGPGELSESAGDLILEYAPGRQALAIGPGLGLNDGAALTVWRVAEAAEVPLVFDADALTHLDGRLEILRSRPSVILTPHPGEAARLLNTTTAEIQADRLGAAKKIAERSGSVVVLKGRHTIIAEPSGKFYLNPSGGPHMAVGGSGDLLTGLSAGLLARKVPAFQAAALAVYVHGRAADLARAEFGPYGLLPGDFARKIPAVFGEMEAAGR